jgi:hypothetical protein
VQFVGFATNKVDTRNEQAGDQCAVNMRIGPWELLPLCLVVRVIGVAAAMWITWLVRGAHR